MDDWIKCSDLMPQPETEFLAYAREYGESEYKIIKASYHDKFQMKGRIPKYKFYEECHCSGFDCDYMDIDDVSHWMPLPDPPQTID